MPDQPTQPVSLPTPLTTSVFNRLDDDDSLDNTQRFEAMAEHARELEGRLRTEQPNGPAEPGAIAGVVFAVSNDGGKTGVAFRMNVFDAFTYLALQNKGGGDYAVVALKC